MCTSSTTSFHGSYYNNTLPIHINRGMIQRGTLNPYLFTIFLKPLLRWIEVGAHGYHLNTSKNMCTITLCVDDLAILTKNIDHLQPHINKLHKLVECAHMDLNLVKCAITCNLNKFKLKSTIFEAFIQNTMNHI